MYFKQIIIFFTFILISTWQPAEAKIFDIESFTLKNGMEVIAIPNHRSPVVSHMVWYKFGAGDDTRGKSGIAHFLEHLMFKGTPSVPDGQFSKTVKKLGGNENAFTSNDYTAYYQNISKKHLETVMKMEADRMKNLTLKKDEVDSERQVIIEERKQRTDNNPQAKFQEQLNFSLFMNAAYATPVIGWLHEIKKLNREDAIDRYKKWYAPNNAILIVAGDITAEELKPLAEKYYGKIKTSKLPYRQRSKSAPLVLNKRLLMSDSKVGQAIIIKLYRAPRGSEALELMSDIFGGGATSRLYKDLVIKQKLAIDIGAEYEPIKLNNTSFAIYATPTPNTSIEKLEKALNLEINKLIKNGVTKTEVQNSIKKKLAGLSYYLDSLQGPALLVGKYLASGFNIDYIKNTDKRFENISVNKINTALRELFSEKNIPIVGILSPNKKKKKEVAHD